MDEESKKILAIKDTNRLLNRLQAMQVQEEQDDKS